MHPKIFEKFTPVEITTDGKSVYDFLGGKINAAYKHGWQPPVAGRTFVPGYPGYNEWMVDWIAVLASAYFADETYSVMELGAGYGQWMTSALQAYHQLKPDGACFGLALEADDVHFEWLKQHIVDNELDRFSRILPVHGAAGRDGTVSFPVLEDPAKNYGASSFSGVKSNSITVPSYGLKSIFSLVSEPLVDLLHIDIQGSEQELIVDSGIEEELACVKFILLGTHRNEALHLNCKRQFESLNFECVIEWPRNSSVSFFGHDIATNDGAILAVNRGHCSPALVRELIA